MNPFSSIEQISSALHKRQISVSELVQVFLRRIAENQDLNCFITVDADGALEAAKKADKLIGQDEGGVLMGIPIAHKDLFCTLGMKTSCGSKMLDNFVAPYDATVVKQLKQAGAISLGKTNMDEFAMGSSNETSYFGPALNPWDTSCVPGGSSGGSAAAVSAGLVVAATGTDTGGSIRQPSSFCGVTGLKPTYGRVSRYGMVAFASSLDQAGPIAHSVADIGLLLKAMEGFDPRDSTSVKIPKTDRFRKTNPIKIGIPKEYTEDLSEKVGIALDEAKNVFSNLGVEFKDIQLPNSRHAIPAYYVISGAEASTNLSRYDGIRYGHRAKDVANLSDLYSRSRSEGFGNEVKRRIITGTYALSVGYYDAYYVKAQKIRRLIRDDFLEAFKEVDLILSPTAPTAAFKRNLLKDDPVNMYLQDIYTIPANLSGLPAISLPAGFDGQLPIGIQLIGPHFDEASLIHVGQLFQQRTDWHQKHPSPGSRNNE